MLTRTSLVAVFFIAVASAMPRPVHAQTKTLVCTDRNGTTKRIFTVDYDRKLVVYYAFGDIDQPWFSVPAKIGEGTIVWVGIKRGLRADSSRTGVITILSDRVGPPDDVMNGEINRVTGAISVRDGDKRPFSGVCKEATRIF